MTDSIQKLVCCMGQPVAGYPVQYVMEKALAAARLDWRVLTLSVAPEHLADAVRGMKAMGMIGGHFIAPHKTAVAQHLDGLSREAEWIGAVNFVRRDGEKLLGENTEGEGFLASLRAEVDPEKKNVVVVGAGCVARAIAVELALAGAARLTIVNRSHERGASLATLIAEKTGAAAEFVPLDGEYAPDANVDVLVNATSIGAGDAHARVPVDVECLGSMTVVADVTINPPRTRLLRDAAQHGCRALDGLAMLVAQWSLALERWTGAHPEESVMREALEEYLEI